MNILFQPRWWVSSTSSSSRTTRRLAGVNGRVTRAAVGSSAAMEEGGGEFELETGEWADALATKVSSLY
jgi:hypothetical protein